MSKLIVARSIQGWGRRSTHSTESIRQINFILAFLSLASVASENRKFYHMSEGVRKLRSFNLIKFDLISLFPAPISNRHSTLNVLIQTLKLRWFITLTSQRRLSQIWSNQFSFAFPLTTGFALETNKFLMIRVVGEWMEMDENSICSHATFNDIQSFSFVINWFFGTLSSYIAFRFHCQ